jgi:hypothetical protein
MTPSLVTEKWPSEWHSAEAKTLSGLRVHLLTSSRSRLQRYVACLGGLEQLPIKAGNGLETRNTSKTGIAGE